MNDAQDWTSVIERSIKTVPELLRELRLEPGSPAPSRRAHKEYPILIPRTYLKKIDVADANDPLLLQVLPSESELLETEGFTKDPLREGVPHGTAASGRNFCTRFLRKYSGRVLFSVCGRCAIHCRFCFRKYTRNNRNENSSFERIESPRALSERECTEIILSGGDPLMLGDEELARLFSRLETFPQLKRIRVHSRLPVVVPGRITPRLAELFRTETIRRGVAGNYPAVVPRRRRIVRSLVLHLNHPAEIDAAFEDAVAALVDQGTPVFVQSVLLRKINDSHDTLFELYERLIDMKIQPYYLHQLDRVAGAAHFEVHEREGLALMRKLRATLPGYALPRYVREIPGEPHKTEIREKHD